MVSGKEITPLPSSHELGEAPKQVMSVQIASEAYQIAIPEDVVRGEQMLRDIKTVEKGMTERKSEITRPLMDSLASVRDLFRPLEEGLDSSKKLIKAKILAYTIAEEEKQLAEAAKIEEKVAKGTLRADTAAGKLAILDGKRVKSNVRTVQKLFISDESLIPREYMIVNRIAVTEALWAGEKVPGAELKDEKTIVIK